MAPNGNIDNLKWNKHDTGKANIYTDNTEAENASDASASSRVASDSTPVSSNVNKNSEVPSQHKNGKAGQISK